MQMKLSVHRPCSLGAFGICFCNLCWLLSIDVRSYRMMNLPRSPGLLWKRLSFLAFHRYHIVIRILQSKESDVELEIKDSSINCTPSCSCGRLSVLTSERGINRKPNCPREMAVEEKMSVIFHCTTIGTIFINVSGIPGCLISSDEGSSYKSPGKGLNERG